MSYESTSRKLFDSKWDKFCKDQASTEEGNGHIIIVSSGDSKRFFVSHTSDPRLCFDALHSASSLVTISCVGHFRVDAKLEAANKCHEALQDYHTQSRWYGNPKKDIDKDTVVEKVANALGQRKEDMTNDCLGIR